MSGCWLARRIHARGRMPTGTCRERRWRRKKWRSPTSACSLAWNHDELYQTHSLDSRIRLAFCASLTMLGPCACHAWMFCDHTFKLSGPGWLPSPIRTPRGPCNFFRLVALASPGFISSNALFRQSCQTCFLLVMDAGLPATLGQTLTANEGLETWRLHATHWWIWTGTGMPLLLVGVNSAVNMFNWDVMSSFPSKLLKHTVETFPPLLESCLSVDRSGRVLQQVAGRMLEVLLPMRPLQMLLFETPPDVFCTLVGIVIHTMDIPPNIDRRFRKTGKPLRGSGLVEAAWTASCFWCCLCWSRVSAFWARSSLICLRLASAALAFAKMTFHVRLRPCLETSDFFLKHFFASKIPLDTIPSAHISHKQRGASTRAKTSRMSMQASASVVGFHAGNSMKFWDQAINGIAWTAAPSSSSLCRLGNCSNRGLPKTVLASVVPVVAAGLLFTAARVSTVSALFFLPPGLHDIFLHHQPCCRRRSWQPLQGGWLWCSLARWCCRLQLDDGKRWWSAESWLMKN